jgi:UDP-N-acetylmuramoylalanine--D-glutamate ligase
MYLLVGYGFSNKEVYKFLKNKRKKVIIYDDLIEKYKIIINFHLIKTVVVSPGIIPTHPILLEAIKKNIPIKMDLDILYKYKRKNHIFIGVTGSNGKSTTVTMMAFLLKIFNINSLLCGNIGKSIFKPNPSKIYIIEISSFQSHYIQDMIFNMGVILNIASNHDDWHGGKDKYLKAKEKLLAHSKIPMSYVNKLPDAYTNNWKINNNILSYKTHSFNITNDNLKLAHNQNNLLMALTLVEKILSLINKKIENIKDLEKINNFKGLEFRQEIILHNNNLIIINDSKSTNIGSTITAIKSAVNFNKKIILLIGGIIKGDLSLLNKEILNNMENIYIFGKNKDFLEAHMKSVDYKAYSVFNNLKDLIAYVINNKNFYNNHIILFSPGGASYDEFKNYMERGRFFNELKKEF